MNHNWYATITAKILFSKDLSDKQKILVAVISNLSNERGYCYASNKYLADCIGCAESTLRQNIGFLEEKGVLNRVMKVKPNGDLDYRALTIISDPLPLSANHLPPDGISSPPPDGQPSYNNKYIITKNNNTSTNSEELGEIETDNSSSTVKAKKEKTSKKKVSKLSDYSPDQATEIYGQCKEAFLTLYLEQYKHSYYWEALNGAKMYSLLRKILFKMKEREDRLYGMTELVDATSFFFKAAYATADNWLQSNFNLSNVDSKFNDIYSKIKAGKHGNQQRKSVAEATRESVRNAFN